MCISWTNKGLNTINMHGATMKNNCNVIIIIIIIIIIICIMY